MWEGAYQRQTRTFITIQRCASQPTVHPVYGMRMIKKADAESVITINVGASFSNFSRVLGVCAIVHTGHPMCAKCAA